MIRAQKLHWRGLLVALFFALLLPVIPAQTVLAATITVDSNADTTTATAANCDTGHTAGSCRLRDAIAKSVAGDTINFSITGTIQVAAAELAIDHDLTITGPGASSLTIDGTNIGPNHLFNFEGPSVAGFFFSSAPTIAISGLTIANDTTSNGAVIANDGGGTLSLTDVILHNSGGNGANGALLKSATATGPSSTVFVGTVTLTRVIADGNGTAATHGGGIDTAGERITVTESAFTNSVVTNSLLTLSTAQGGTSSITITNSTFSGNTTPTGTISAFSASGSGPATTLTIVNSTLSGNTTNAASAAVVNMTGNCAGFCSGSTAHLIVVNSTIANTVGGFGIVNAPADAGDPADVTLKNTLVAGNVAGDLSGTSYSGTNNLIGNAGSAGGFTDTTNGNIVGHPALLGTLSDNGSTFTLPDGSHIQTIPLQTSSPTSPAIDAGASNPTYTNPNTGSTVTVTADERGTSRPKGPAFDIGAFEATPVPSLAPPAGALTAGTVGVAYSQQFTGSGGSGAPFTYAATGTPPPGLTLATGTGLLSGTPTQAGPFSFSITVTDTATTPTTQAYTLQINPAGTTVAVTNAAAPFSSAAQNVTLSATVTDGIPVNEGTVTFTVTNSSSAIVGSAVTSGTVTNGAASATFSIPASTPVGAYTITAVYNPAASNPAFTTGTGTGTLTVQTVTQLTLTPTSAFTGQIKVGGTATFTVTATFSDNSTSTVTNQAQWSPTNSPIVSVDGHGNVTGQGAGGPVTVTVTYGGKSATVQVTVTGGTSVGVAPVAAPSGRPAGTAGQPGSPPAGAPKPAPSSR